MACCSGITCVSLIVVLPACMWMSSCRSWKCLRLTCTPSAPQPCSCSGYACMDAPTPITKSLHEAQLYHARITEQT